MTEDEMSSNDESWRGKVGKMDAEDMARFLHEPNVGRLGCLDPEGWPYVVPTWYQSADGGFWIIPRQKSIWAEYLAKDGRVSLSIDEAAAPYRKVVVKGIAELVERPNVGARWVEIANEMSLRYLGENGPKYLVPTLNEPRWLFFLRPEKVTTWQGVDWAKKYKTAE